MSTESTQESPVMSGSGKREGENEKTSSSSSSESSGYGDSIYEECLAEQTKVAAELALDPDNFAYPEKISWCRHGRIFVIYEVDRPLTSNGFRRMGCDVVHVNFTAKKVFLTGITLPSDQPSEHFFAELMYYGDSKRWLVNDCVMYDPADETNPEKISKSCDRCGEEFGILHPVGHYVLGLYDGDHYLHDEVIYEDDDFIDYSK